jgi:polysaccharide export outer membrane protein
MPETPAQMGLTGSEPGPLPSVAPNNPPTALRPVAATVPAASPSGAVAATLQMTDGQLVPIASTRTVSNDEPEQTPQPRTAPVANGAPLIPVAPLASGGFDAHHHDQPRECAKQSLPPYIVEPPDVLLVQASKAATGGDASPQLLEGPALVRPDGTISLGVYGDLYVTGMTLANIRDLVAQRLKQVVFPKDEKRTVESIRQEVRVDVIAYNSKVYYVIASNGGYGEQIYRVPITGNETVMDALAYIQGLPVTASLKKVFLARSTCDPHHPTVLRIDYKCMTRMGSAETNYQIFPNDRIFVGADPWIVFDSGVAKRLSPFERLMGATLLGATTYNAITNRHQ